MLINNSRLSGLLPVPLSTGFVTPTVLAVGLLADYRPVINTCRHITGVTLSLATGSAQLGMYDGTTFYATRTLTTLGNVADTLVSASQFGLAWFNNSGAISMSYALAMLIYS